MTTTTKIETTIARLETEIAEYRAELKTATTEKHREMLNDMIQNANEAITARSAYLARLQQANGKEV